MMSLSIHLGLQEKVSEGGEGIEEVDSGATGEAIEEIEGQEVAEEVVGEEEDKHFSM